MVFCGAARIGRIGLLKVYHVKDSETTAKEASGTSPVGHSVLKLDLESDVFFGGVDAKFDVSTLNKNRNYILIILLINLFLNLKV